jgi:cellulose synthase (UDP-forming)
MPSKDAWGAVFCCGTSSAIRVRALEDCGGFPTDSVTEDFLLTLRLDRMGWRTVYLNESLSVGLAPEGMTEYITQRGRWCLGLMQILRSPLGPFSRNRLSLPLRAGLIDAFLYWSVGFLFKLLCLLAPIVYWFTGVTMGTAPAADVIGHFLPYYVAVMVTLYWATGGLIQPVLTDVSHVLTMPAALRATVTGLLKPRGHPFKVTPKGGIRDRMLVQWRRIAGLGLLLGLTILGMLYGSLADYTPERQEAGSTAIVLFWSIYNIIVLLLAMAVCVEFPRYRSEERVATTEPVKVSAGENVFPAALTDISYPIPVRATHGRDSQGAWDVIHRGKRVGVCHGSGSRASGGLRGGSTARAGEALGGRRSDATVVGAGGDLRGRVANRGGQDRRRRIANGAGLGAGVQCRGSRRSD